MSALPDSKYARFSRHGYSWRVMRAILVASLSLLIGQTMRAEVIAEHSSISRNLFGEIEVELAFEPLEAPIIRYLSSPYRVIFEFNDLDLGALPDDFGYNQALEIEDVIAANFGNVGESSRLVLTFNTPYKLSRLSLSENAAAGRKGMRAKLRKVDEEQFLALVETLGFQDEEASSQEEGVAIGQIGPRRARPASIGENAKTGESGGAGAGNGAMGNSIPLIVIDPGHGGIDPGAIRDGVSEKDIVLGAAKTIEAHIRASGRYEVMLTRDDDRFVPLAERRKMAERLGAALFLSIHADAISSGDARGTTIYTLSKEASDQNAARFAEFENQVDLFAGEYASEAESDLSALLADLAQTASNEKSKAFSRLLQKSWQSINVRPEYSRRKSGGFLVLKAPEIPSLLLEIGYISNPEDRAKMREAAWLEEMARNLLAALDAYFAN